MKKVIYTFEQMLELTNLLDSLTVKGISNCKAIALSAQIIDKSIEIIDEEDKAKEEVTE